MDDHLGRLSRQSVAGKLNFVETIERDSYHYKSGKPWACFQVASRVGCAVCIPLDMIACPIDAAIGLTAAVASLLTLGTKEQPLRRAMIHLYGFGNLISSLFNDVLHFINPSSHCVGYIPVRSKLNSYTRKHLHICLNNNKSFFDRQIKSRFLNVVSLVATVVGRIIDFIIGIVATPLALIALGTVRELNDAAFQGLGILNLVADIFIHLIRIINPYAGYSKGPYKWQWEYADEI